MNAKPYRNRSAYGTGYRRLLRTLVDEQCEIDNMLRYAMTQTQPNNM